MDSRDLKRRLKTLENEVRDIKLELAKPSINQLDNRIYTLESMGLIPKRIIITNEFQSGIINMTMGATEGGSLALLKGLPVTVDNFINEDFIIGV